METAKWYMKDNGTRENYVHESCTSEEITNQIKSNKVLCLNVLLFIIKEICWADFDSVLTDDDEVSVG